MNHSDEAERLFREGYNCAQSVFAAFTDVTGMDRATALRYASGFGAGFGKLREVCGAVCGMTLLNGYLNGYTEAEDRAGKIALYHREQALCHAFEATEGSIICRELLHLAPGQDPAEPSIRTEEYYRSRPCIKCIRRAAELADTLVYGTYVTLRERPDLKETAAQWFSGKWGVPVEAYLACMSAYLDGETEYGWYLCLDGGRIVGGLGVIENDFHDRKDLAPNVCAVYTEEDHRGRGIAGRLLGMVVEDMRSRGISPLYLITDHTSFYERYGWEYLCMVRYDGTEHMSRMYIHR